MIGQHPLGQHRDHRAIGDVSILRIPRAVAVHDLHQADALCVAQQQVETTDLEGHLLFALLSHGQELLYIGRTGLVQPFGLLLARGSD